MPMWRADELLSQRIAKDVGEGLFFLGERMGDADIWDAILIGVILRPNKERPVGATLREVQFVAGEPFEHAGHRERLPVDQLLEGGANDSVVSVPHSCRRAFKASVASGCTPACSID